MTRAEEEIIDQALAGWLQSGVVPDFPNREAVETYLHRIDLHGISSVLALDLASHATLPEALRVGLLSRHFSRENWEIGHGQIFRDAIDALSEAGMKPLVFKGTALAWTHYARPAMRIRGDTDILVDAPNRDLAIAALRNAGFQSPMVLGGEVIRSEKPFQKLDDAGLSHDIDMHWRINSSYVINQAFSYDELSERSVPFQCFDTPSFRVSDIDLLLITSFHRQLHFHRLSKTTLGNQQFSTIDRLIWLLDIDLLFKSIPISNHGLFVQLAKAKGLASVCRQTLEHVHRTIGTDIPKQLLDELSTTNYEPIAEYLEASLWRRKLLNLIACPGLINKIQFCRELLFPKSEYIRLRFGEQDAESTFPLYIKRMITGVRKYF